MGARGHAPLQSLVVGQRDQGHLAVLGRAVPRLETFDNHRIERLGVVEPAFGVAGYGRVAAYRAPPRPDTEGQEVVTIKLVEAIAGERQRLGGALGPL